MLPILSEVEWRITDDPHAMLRVLDRNPCASDRKLRLYACVCAAFAISQHPNRADYQHILTTAEQLAEGRAEPDEVRRCWDEGISFEIANDSIDAHLAAAMTDALQIEPHRAACGPIHELERYAEKTQRRFDPKPFADLLRCIFGIPYRGFYVDFRLLKLDPAWCTSDVVALARGIYDERAFDRMPILADALQDAGCDNDDILNHCRDTATPHARGCWVVDLVLGKE